MQNYLPPYFADHQRMAKIQDLFPEIDAMYQNHAEKNGYPGYAYGIVLDGKLIHSGNGGFADVEKKVPFTSQSLFRIASMTKSFTAMAILKLRDEGRLRLDDPIALYIPEMEDYRLTEDSSPITIRDLLTHSAGFPTDDPWGDRKLDETDEQLSALLRNKIHFSNPSGIVFEYSNLGYTILGHLIKKVTGISHQEFIDKTICKPLGMKIFWEYTDVPADKLVHGYNAKNGEEPLLHDGIFGAMGGLITSIEAFASYMAHHQNAWPPRNDPEAGPIKRSSLREMHRPWKFINLETDGSSTSSYGYGLKCLRYSSGRVFVGHRGGLPGFGSNWFFLPEYGLGIVSFANLTYADTSKIDLEALNKLVWDAKLQPRELPVSNVLKETKDKLLPLLPNWDKIPEGIFADNFFLDNSLKSLQQEAQDLFSKAGNIVSVSEVVPENQLRGHFILQAEKAKLQINFALTPENPCQIQQYQIKEINQ